MSDCTDAYLDDCAGPVCASCGFCAEHVYEANRQGEGICGDCEDRPPAPKKIARRIREWDGGRVVLWHLDPPIADPETPFTPEYEWAVSVEETLLALRGLSAECLLFGADDNGEVLDVNELGASGEGHDQVIRDAGYTIQGGDV